MKKGDRKTAITLRSLLFSPPLHPSLHFPENEPPSALAICALLAGLNATPFLSLLLSSSYSLPDFVTLLYFSVSRRL